MARKQGSRDIKRGSDTDDKRKLGGFTGALVEAAVELGHAAEELKSSVAHVRSARKKGKDAIEPVKRAGKKAANAVRKRLSRR